MNLDLETVKFDNQVNPSSSFDLVRLEDLLSRSYETADPKKLHQVSFYLILLITEGEGKHTIDFTDYEYSKGSLLTIRKDQIHQFHDGIHPKGYVLLFTDDFLVSYLEKLIALKSIQLFNELLSAPKMQLNNNEYGEVLLIMKSMNKEYYDISDIYTPGVVRSELHILITKLFRIKSQKNSLNFDKKYLSEFINFQTLVEENVFKTLKVKDYASKMGVSTKTLNTVSQQILNKSAKAFIDNICVIQIKRLLINTDLTIKEIAYTTGFEETSNFYKYFKRIVGTTPEQFRENL